MRPVEAGEREVPLQGGGVVPGQAHPQFRTPGVWNVDLGLFRSFPVGRFRPEIRIEATNVFNHTNWGRPNLTFTDPQFLTFAPSAAHQFNTIWGTGTRERTVQVGLRLEF